MNDNSVYVATMRLPINLSRAYEKGEVVPKEYPRFDEGIRRGWIIEKSAAPVKTPEPDEPSEVNDSKPVIDLYPGITLTSKISDLDFVTSALAESLESEGFDLIVDLKGHSKKELTAVQGVGNVKATELLNALAEIEKRK